LILENRKKWNTKSWCQNLLEFIDDVVDELGSRKEIDYIHQIMEMGTGADRQLAVFEQTGSMNAVVDYIVAETKVGLNLKFSKVF
jgi:carboxylate-amine ligase